MRLGRSAPGFSCCLDATCHRPTGARNRRRRNPDGSRCSVGGAWSPSHGLRGLRRVRFKQFRLKPVSRAGEQGGSVQREHHAARPDHGGAGDQRVSLDQRCRRLKKTSRAPPSGRSAGRSGRRRRRRRRWCRLPAGVSDEGSRRPSRAPRSSTGRKRPRSDRVSRRPTRCRRPDGTSTTSRTDRSWMAMVWPATSTVSTRCMAAETRELRWSCGCRRPVGCRWSAGRPAFDRGRHDVHAHAPAGGRRHLVAGGKPGSRIRLRASHRTGCRLRRSDQAFADRLVADAGAVDAARRPPPR